MALVKLDISNAAERFVVPGDRIEAGRIVAREYPTGGFVEPVDIRSPVAGIVVRLPEGGFAVETAGEPE